MKEFWKAYGNIVLLIIVALYWFIIETEDTKGLGFDSQSEKVITIEHSKKKDIHLTVSELGEQFIPRTELQEVFKGIDEKQDLIIQMIRDK